MRLKSTSIAAFTFCLAGLSACADGGQALSEIGSALGTVIPGSGPSQTDIAAALRQALSQGTSSAVSRLGRADGFWADPQVRIPLPGFIAKYESTVRAIGYGSTLDQFQLTLNRAAELAVPKVTSIFADSISQMTLADAKAILQGPDNAATEFFRRTASQALYAQIRPIVVDATGRTGVTQQYKKVAAKAGPIMRLAGSTPPVDLDDYVTQQALNGLFTKIADEEGRIRRDPAARTTELLRKVFGSKIP